MRTDRNVMVNFKLGEHMRKIDFFIFQSVTQATKKKKTLNTRKRSRAYDLDVTSQADTQPASYTRLVGAKATKLGSSEAHW